jgi:PAS domain S-box-containing protein
MLANQPEYEKLAHRLAQVEAELTEARQQHEKALLELRRTDQALKEAMAKGEHEKRSLQAVLEALPIGVAITDAMGGTTQFNRAYDELWGRPRPTPGQVSDYSAYKAWWAESGQPVRPEEWASARAVTTGEPVVHQMVEIERFNGQRTTVINSGAPIRDAAGNIVGSAIAIEDISDLLRAEKALRASEEALRQLSEQLEQRVRQRAAELERANTDLRQEIAERKRTEAELAKAQDLAEQRALELEATYQTAPVGLAVLDRELRFVRINRRLAEINGLPVAAHIGRTVREVVPAMEEQALTTLDRILETTEPLLNIEFRGQTPAQPGVDRIWNANWFPLRDHKGEITGVNVVIEEITERKRADTVLAETAERAEAERKRFNDLLETLPAYLILLTPDYHVCFANRFFRERFGESNGRRCYEYLFQRTEPCETCETYTVLKNGKAHHWQWTGPDGRNYDIFDLPFTDEDGSPLIMEMGIDITEQRRAENELKRTHLELTARAAQLRVLAGELTLVEQRERRRMAKMLHDHLQQLLVCAKLHTAILSRAGDELVKNASKEIEGLLDDSISASRSLTAELSPPILHEGGLIPGLEWLARWMADKYGLFVDLSLEVIAQPIGNDVKILLFESVRELLFNVVKHSHTRSATVNLRIVDGQLLQIVVTDQGAGFEPQSIKPAGQPGGCFGLFSIRERMDLLGGKMEMSSAPGEGSRFVLTTPLGQPTPIPPEPIAVVSEQGGTGPAIQATSLLAGAKIRVLLADDHAIMREGLAHLLSAEPDIQIIGEAADGQEAVELAGKLLPDVILMDVSMPKLNGVEATRTIRNELPDIRIIGLSMFDEPEWAQAMLDAGAVNYLSKSGLSNSLIAAIRRCMDEAV